MATTPTGNAAQTTQTDPNNDLRSKTISIAPTANRMDLAGSYLKNWDASTAPQFQADINKATSNAAANGQLGSGGLRTSLGNLAYNRDLQRNTQASNFYNDALQGSIGDAQFNVGQANQQQAYQTGLQGQAFNQNLQQSQFNQQKYNDQFSQSLAGTQQANATQAQQFNQGVTNAQLQAQLQAQQFGQGLSTQQFASDQQNQLFNQGLSSSQLAAALQQQQFGQGVTQAQLNDSLANSGQNRAAQLYTLGNAGGDLSQLYMAMSGQYGNQAQQGQASLGNLIGNTSQNNTNNSILNTILQGVLKPAPSPTQTGVDSVPSSGDYA
jgi:hypothetical protein